MELSRRDCRAIEYAAICLMLLSSFSSYGGSALSAYLVPLRALGFFAFAFCFGYCCYASFVADDTPSSFPLRCLLGIYKRYWLVFLLFLPAAVYAQRALRSLLIREIIYNFLSLSCSFCEEWGLILPFALLCLLLPGIKRGMDTLRGATNKAGIHISVELLIILATAAAVGLLLPRVTELSLFSTLVDTVLWARVNELLSLLPAFLLGCVFAEHGVLSRAKSPRVRRFSPRGDEVFFMYLVHGVFLRYFPRLLALPKNAALSCLWLFILCFVCARCLSFLSQRLGVLFRARDERARAAAESAEFSKRDTAIIKGIGICLMLCHHLFTFPERLIDVGFISVPFLNGMTLAGALGQFGKICVALFTLLSGYGTYISLHRAKDDTRFVTRHLKNLYLAYWKVFLVVVPISLAVGSVHSENLAADMVYSFFALRLTFCNEWWFVVPFAVLVALSPLTRRLIDERVSSFSSGFLFLVAFNAAIYYLINPLMQSELMSALSRSVFWAFFYSALTLWPAFALGGLLARFDVLSVVKSRCGARTGWVIAALAACGALIYIHPFNWVAYDFINAAVFLCCMIILLSTALGRFVAPVFEKLGAESTSMWLIHTLLCYQWCQKAIFAPRYAFLIFLWLLILSYIAARLLRLLWGFVSRAAANFALPRAKS